MKRVSSTLAIAALLALPSDIWASSDVGPPLPPVATVLKRVAETSATENENDRAFREQYHFTKTKVTEFRNENGEVKKREEKKREYDPLRKSRAAQPQYATQKAGSTGGPKADEAGSEARSIERGKGFGKDDLLMNPGLLKRFDFKVTGREVLNGRPALVVDFQPARTDLPVRNLKDRFINKAAGRVWVDEADYALVKADLRLTEQVNVVGGLVGAVRKFTFGFLRERTAEGLWFTRNTGWHLEGREVFVHRTVDYREERADVHKVVQHGKPIDDGPVDD